MASRLSEYGHGGGEWRPHHEQKEREADGHDEPVDEPRAARERMLEVVRLGRCAAHERTARKLVAEALDESAGVLGVRLGPDQ